jgi:hypothetical protein
VKIEQFDFSVNLLRAILWQYNDAENLQGILQSKQDWYNTNQRDFWQDWYDNVFNLLTANDFGLNVWAIILGLPLNVTFAPSDGEDIFDFGVDNEGFGEGSFGTPSSGTVITLSTEQARIALRLRYYQITCRPCAWQTNEFLADLFADYGQVYVGDNTTMSDNNYVFLFEPPASLKFVIEQFDLLPRPATIGVSISYNPEEKFAFGIDNEGFAEGSFGE